MKNYVFALVTVLGSTASLFAQENHDKRVVPTKEAINGFEKNFPGAAKVKWEQEKNNYEVNFIQKGKDMSALLSRSGVLVESEMSITKEQLPAAALDYIAKNFKGQKIKEAAKITSSEKIVTYEAEVNKTDLIFDAQGKFIKIAKD